VKVVIEVTPNYATRIMEARMSGLYSEQDMRRASELLHEVTKGFAGKRHIVIADMRGMKAVHPSLATILGEAIGYQRANGCVLCLHVSDDTVQKLQVARVARKYSPQDDVTVDVDSVDAARSLARSYAKFLDDPKFEHSIRAAIAL
jgi:hypothetical protein